MTRKEAIDILKNTIVQLGRTNGKTAYAEALYMAISALEQPEIIRCNDCEKYGTMFCAIDIWTEDVTIYTAKPDDFCSRAERREK